ncbi:MAG: hypothetical protein EOO20_04715 [Chryseobacterium sp.]|nr:MAG: hypothetical protein EOO20_04715 [Chryseobacterium sp.]
MESSRELQLKIDRKVKELKYIKIIEKCIEKVSPEYHKEIKRDAKVDRDSLIFKLPSGNDVWSNEILKSVLEIQKKISRAYVKAEPEYSGDTIRLTTIYGY